MTKEMFKNAFKNIFHKTRIVCPHCGTVQRHDADTCCICGNDLKFLHDDTYKLKNIIRVSLGCITAAVIVAATLIVCNIIKSSDSDKPVSKEVYADETTESVEETNKATEPVTTEQKTEEPTTEKATEKPTEKPTEPPTEAPTTPDQLVEWVCRPSVKTADIVAGNDIIKENSWMRETGKGDWWSRVFPTDKLEYNGDGGYYETDFGIADYNGNVLLSPSYELKVSEDHGAVFSAKSDQWGAIYDVNGNPTGDFTGGLGDEGGGVVYNTYNGKLIGRFMMNAEEHEFEDGGDTGQAVWYYNVYYDGKYEKNDYGSIMVSPEKEKGLDTYTMLNCGSGKAVATVDDVFRYDTLDGKNYYIVRKGKKYTYIDANAQSIVPGEYEEAYQFRDGMAAVKKNGKAGFINSKGETVVPFIFEETRNCYDGKAWVKYNGLWGVIKVK